MINFVVRRLTGMLVTLLLLSLFTFVLSRAVPGAPWMNNVEIPLSKGQEDLFRAKYGLDKPLAEQYLIWLRNAVTLDFGRSFNAPELTVGQLIGKMLPYSALLGGIAALFAVTVGIVLGILAAARQNSLLDNIITTYSVLIGTIPGFVMGFVLVYFFAVQLRWFPSGGWKGASSLVLPVLAYALPATGGIARGTRQFVLEVMSADYVRTARAKGAGQAAILFKHVLRNAMIPIVTSYLPIFPGMMTGSVFIETVFGLPGLGTFFASAASNRDYPLVLGVTLFWALLISLTFLLTDVLYGVIDPRIRVQKEAGR